MKLNPDLYMKWIRANDPFLSRVDLKMINLCLLLAKNARGVITGLTIFEPKDLSHHFLHRLESRKGRPEFADANFELFLPTFLKHRAEPLVGGLKFGWISVNYTPFLHVKQSSGRLQVRSKIRVVSVDDSPVLLKFLKHSMEEVSFFEVVTQVSDPLRAVDVIQQFSPDLVTMDIQMPGKTGVEVVRDLLAVQHFPVLMISSLSLDDGSLVFDALNNGAFDYIQKPNLNDVNSFKEELQNKALLAIEGRHAHSAMLRRRNSAAKTEGKGNDWPENLLWCIGASTGGTQAITRIFTNLPAKVPPILIVQHIPPVYSKAFADSLNQLCPFTIKEAEHGEIIQANFAYVAPGGMQMGVEKKQGRLYICIKDAPPVNRFKPSVDYLFAEIAKLTQLKIVAGVLTGMGRDGANGLKLLKEAGAATFAQDEESSTVYGMPRAAFEAGATDRVVHLDQVAHELLNRSVKVPKSA